MPRFTFRQLELFAALPDHPTLSSAARALHVSESALSHAITELEDAVGDRLCVRQKARGMYLTPTGRHFARRARGLLRDADELTYELGEQGGRLAGPVSLGCYTGIASTVLPAVLEGMERLYPGIDVNITVGDHADLLPGIEKGTLDTALLYNIDIPPTLERQSIYETEVLAVLSPDDELSSQEDIDLAQLAEKPLILLDTTPSTGYSALMFAQRGLKPRMGAVVPQIDLVRALVGRGLGYSLLMSRPHQIPTTSEGLPVVARRLTPRAGVTHVVAVWAQKTTLTPRAKALVDYAVSSLTALEPQ